MVDVSSGPKMFTWLVLLSQVLGLTVVVLVAVWMGNYNGGFSWTNSSLTFNYHPLFMIIGLIFLNGDAILAYRVFRNVKKIYVKITHAALHVGALIFATIGLVAVFDFHNSLGIQNLYSLHSWMGLITVILYAIQWLFGFVTFLFPKLSEGIRQAVMPYHVYHGLAIFFLAISVALMGITEKAFFKLTGTHGHPKYADFPSEGLLCNFLGIFLVILGGVVGYIVARPEYKRPLSADEEHLTLTDE